MSKDEFDNQTWHSDLKGSVNGGRVKPINGVNFEHGRINIDSYWHKYENVKIRENNYRASEVTEAQRKETS